MKNRISISILFLLTLLNVELYSQSYAYLTDNLDSLKKETNAKHTNEELALLYLTISSTYLHVNSDSSIYYGEKCLESISSESISSLKSSAIGTIIEGLIYKGNLPKALEMGLARIKEVGQISLSESGNGRIYNGIGDIYIHLEDYEKARYYFTELTQMTAQDFIGIAFGHYQLAVIEENQDNLDSALYHLNKSFELFSVINKSDNPYVYETYPGWYNLRAKVYAKQNKPELAKADLLKTLEITEKSGEQFHSSNTYYDFAKLFISLNEKDSSIYYAEKALFVAEDVHYTKGILNASELLSTLYEDTDAKKALKYFKLNEQAKSQLYSSGNIQALKDMVAQNELQAAELEHAKTAFQNKLKLYFLLAGLLAVLGIAFILYRNNKRKQQANDILQTQKEEIESTLSQLKSTQSQLIQSEKMASLGELTAGIAHEIQNPLNFVNNFSEVTQELGEELAEEGRKEQGERDIGLEAELIGDINENLQKINHHGNRASSIVKGMLEHSQTSTGEKVPTDINALADEFLRLAYHGLRAKDKDFQSDFTTHFDENLPKVSLVTQDIGRVILNLINNSFQAVTERSRSVAKEDNYKPLVTISSKLKANSQVLIAIKDNGPGIPPEIKDKIFQPFFTTKPTGKGTGLGLSLAYDIVKAHGGELTVKTEKGKTVFSIHLPIKKS